jgi:putative oxidoreductase
MVLESHFYILVFGAQLIVGLLLLSNQYVPLAIVVLGAVLANVLTFHITMAPESIAPAIVAALLWVFVAWSIREEFTTLLERTPARAQMVSDQTEPERSMSR